MLRALITQNHSFLNGVLNYISYDELNLNSPKIIHKILSSELAIFGDKGRPILILPSLINNSEILNFSEDKSLVKSLMKQGFQVFMINWLPKRESEEIEFGFLEYVDQIILRYTDLIIEKTGVNPLILGHCMGGLLATFAANKYPEKYRGLIVLSMPWDFSDEVFMKVDPRILSEFLSNYKFVPAQFISSIFAISNAGSIYKKYIGFENNFSSETSGIEKWLNSGLDMSKKLFMECIGNLINKNCLTKEGNCYISEKIDIEVMQFLGRKDKVVPRNSSLAFSESCSNLKVKEFEAGHLGIIFKFSDELAQEISKAFFN